MRSLPLSSASWRFRDATTRSPWRPAVVPGCVHTDLLRRRLIPDPFWASNEAALQWIEERDWEYRAMFTVPTALLAEQIVDLVADGLDTIATVWVNGTEVARTENMFLDYRWNVKPLLRKGRNELLIRFASAVAHARSCRLEHQPRETNDPVGRCVVVRKEQCQFGWDWGPRFVTAGIWRDIRLEAWSGNRLDSVRVTQEHHADRVVLRLEPELARTDEAVTLRWRLELEDPREAGVGAPLVGARTGENGPRRATGVGRRQATPLEGAGSGATITIDDPQLWWPNGLGAQPLYRLEVEAFDSADASLGRWERRIGLRTIELDRHKDEWGESFQFVVNGRPVFAKGANWIPAHTFVAGLTRADYARDLSAAAHANMNMIRVWGGGIYESEEFYDLCDELGLMVWQDFMFACTRYPADQAFLDSSRAEAEYQARRLRHRASLALWCGNNEVYGCNWQELAPDPRKFADYERLFHEVLPAGLRAADAVTPYWPSSPWRGDTDADHAAGEQRGDTHFWDVWHARQPVKDYEKYLFRFVSEFGMQSYSSPETNATFCPPHADNVFGPEMENHQKNRFGNQIILDYVSRLYRFPQGQDALIYLSQLNQAACMQFGVEHWRRHQPRCMGALYWQLNDCWPVASWSSIEFTGRWKALHYAARRFFAPALVSAHVIGEEQTIIGNYRRSNIDRVDLYTVYDAPEPARGILRWEVRHLDGRTLLHGSKPVELRYGESIRQETIELGEGEQRASGGGRLGAASLPAEARREASIQARGGPRPPGRGGSPRRAASLLQKHGPESIYLRIALDLEGRGLPTPPKSAATSRRSRETPPHGEPLMRVSEDTVFLTAPRFLELPDAKTKVTVKLESPRRATLGFVSDAFQHRFAFELRGIEHRADDNYFDLYPGEVRTVAVECAKPQTAAELKRALTHRSLVDSY